MIILHVDVADVAEQADARDLKSLGVTAVPVQVRSSAPSLNRLNLFTVGKTFGLFCFIEEFNNYEDKNNY